MPQINIAPTKSSLLRVKKDLSFAKEGFSLLEQKREFLVLELMNYLADAKVIEKEAEEKLNQAYSVYMNAVASQGLQALKQAGKKVVYNFDVEPDTHHLMGVALPKPNFNFPKLAPIFSFLSSSSAHDELLFVFRDALQSLVRLAVIRISVIRLAKEVKKTQRRVNALEKIFIPGYEETKRFIEGALEEKDRESFFTSKVVKSNMEKKAKEN